ncbi:isocitrate lyase/phosphoenolpyruvate mutase family protein [Bradyrhizobium sp. LMTR 3]|uniref:isocitrate lyase/phosphoenolpyruvate mutase family protein n=1 Tax=Bradyrhizobium sp. LMTR 3 TaxID=189873 RepID=UPI000A0604D6|nr:isocitrate lyase/phosphoenolpyruvate mutase family protein [Bradyrhizobium sp. LMTR 3]
MQHEPQSVVACCPDRCAASSRAEILSTEVCSNRDLSFLMEAHDRLSGAVTERADLKALWTTSLSITCSHGYHNSNEASADELVDRVERIIGSTDPRVLVYGYGDFGNFDNERLLARKLISRARWKRTASSWPVSTHRGRQFVFEVRSDINGSKDHTRRDLWRLQKVRRRAVLWHQ